MTRKIRQIAWIVAMLGALPAVLWAAEPAHPSVALSDEWTLSVDGQLRPRFVADSGRDFKPGDLIQRDYVTQRTRLGVTVSRADGLAAVVRLQDVRVWGEEPDTTDFAARGLDLHEAYIQVPMGTDWKWRLGRQEIALDNHRLVGNADWFQRGRTFDAARLTWASGDWTVDAFLSQVISQSSQLEKDGHVVALPLASTVTGDIAFGGLHATWQPNKDHKIAAMYLWRGAKPTHEQRHTAGVFAEGRVDNFSYTAEGYYQFGTIPEGTISAYLLAAKLGYTLDVAWKPGVSIWTDVVSGDGTHTGAFDTLYATNHRYYGEMDFFLDLPKNTGYLGLIDVGAGLHVSPSDRMKIGVDFHEFRAEKSDSTGASAFGEEINVRASRHWAPWLSTSCLYGVFLPGATMATVRGIASGKAETEQFAYLTVDARF
jgi:hypothetical protein